MTVSGSAQPFSAQVAWPGLGRTLLAGLLAFAVMIGGMALALMPYGAIPTEGELFSTMPTRVGAFEFHATGVSDARYGLQVDGALTTLERGRDDASIVSGASPDGSLSILAVAVTGVTFENLTRAIVGSWGVFLPIDEATLGGKEVHVLVGPAPERAYVYSRGVVVYIVESADEQLAAEALAALP